jgi:nucleotide-binding universal stress UspA family protein
MSLPKKFLVATDFSETSDKALDYAVALAKELDGSVTLLHAYEIPVMGFPDGALIAGPDVAARILNGAQAGLEAQAAKRRGAGVPIAIVLKDDPPWEAVNEVAEEINADLIVIGTHGRRGLARALLGSVAENIIRRAVRPVLVLHGPREEKS